MVLRLHAKTSDRKFLFLALHTFGYRKAQNAQTHLIYFAVQLLVVAGLMWLAALSDAFTFRFFVLGIQAMIVLPTRWRARSTMAWGILSDSDDDAGTRCQGRAESNGAPMTLAIGALNQAETWLQEALTDVRRSVALLRGTAQSSRPLAATIADLVNQPNQQVGLAVQFVQTGAPQPLPSQVELTLYVAQEGLTNVRKHAQASQAAMTLAYATDKVQVQIRDKGKGCDTPTGGYGLIGLRERALV